MTTPTPDIVWLALAVFLLPLVSALVLLAIPGRYGWIAPILATLLMFISTIFSFFIFFRTWPLAVTRFDFPWFSVGIYSADIRLSINFASALMLLTVTSVSFLVHLYSTSFMAGEIRIVRYFVLLGLFTTAMTGLVLSNTLPAIFLCWEWMGVCSYLLIGFWQEKAAATGAAFKAFLMNRVGDVCFLIGILIMWVSTGSAQLDEWMWSLSAITEATRTWAGIFILIGIMSKSAQFPLYSWLPDAMEGPTPVSALIHAATMVAAGVYLMIRLDFLFTPDLHIAIAIIGAVTALIGGLAAMTECNIKKILAYSTVSQLGLMVMASGAGAGTGAFIHLINHAFFKGCLFLSAGAIIQSLDQATKQQHAIIDIQDIRNLGGLVRKLPLEAVAFFLAAGSLTGLPFFTGFISKDMILDELNGSVFKIIGLVIIALTSAYTFRLVWYVFFGESRAIRAITLPYPMTPWLMRIPILILAAGSTWLFYAPMKNELVRTLSDVFLSHDKMYLFSTSAVFVGIIASWFYYRRLATDRWNAAIITTGIDVLYKKTLIAYTLRLSTFASALDRTWIDSAVHFAAYGQVTVAHLAGWLDRNIVDGIAVGVGKTTRMFGNWTRSLANGKIQSYITWAITGLIIFIVWILLK